MAQGVRNGKRSNGNIAGSKARSKAKSKAKIKVKGNAKRKRHIYEMRKRRRIRRMLFVLVSVCFVLMAFKIKDTNVQIEEIKAALETAQSAYEAERKRLLEIDILGGGQAAYTYAQSVKTIDVAKPVKRTRTEAVERLKELGGDNDDIAWVVKNEEEYPEDLLMALANNPEMADFAVNYREYIEEPPADELSGLTDSEKEQAYPLFLQWDRRWGYKPYGGSCIGLAGCGPTCLSMVLFYLTGDAACTPDRVADYGMKNGFYVEGTGTAWALMENVPFHKLRVMKLSLSRTSFVGALDSGYVIICAMGEGDFTTSGHFIVIYGYDEDGFMVNDPNCVARSRRRWGYDEIEGQIKSVWAYGS